MARRQSKPTPLPGARAGERLYRAMLNVLVDRLVDDPLAVTTLVASFQETQPFDDLPPAARKLMADVESAYKQGDSGS